MFPVRFRLLRGRHHVKIIEQKVRVVIVNLSTRARYLFYYGSREERATIFQVDKDFGFWVYATAKRYTYTQCIRPV